MRILFVLLCFVGLSTSGQSNRFGDSIPVSNGLVGHVFLLPDTTRRLPDFDTMEPIGTVLYVREINVPDTNWSAGFPGLRDRFEWFGIEYKGDFRVLHPGKYRFRLDSDDGSKLWIDDSLLIDNDGMHAEYNVRAEKNFADSGSMHTIRLRYWQGPRYQLALQLFWTVGDAKEELFPGKGFVLYTPQVHRFPWWWLVVAALVIGGWWWMWWKRRKKANSSRSLPSVSNG